LPFKQDAFLFKGIGINVVLLVQTFSRLPLAIVSSGAISDGDRKFIVLVV
jgi:hypothetical protein